MILLAADPVFQCDERRAPARSIDSLSWLPSAFSLALAACLVVSASIGVVALVRLYVITGAAFESIVDYFRTEGAR